MARGEVASVAEMARGSAVSRYFGGALRGAIRFCRAKPLGAAGAALVLLMLVIAMFPGQIAPLDPGALRSIDALTGPGAQHWFGTDDLGRDVASRVIWGARISMYVAVLAVLFGTTAGAILGLTSGYLGGKVDLLVQRLMDALMILPPLVIAMAVVAALGAGLNNMVIAICIIFIPSANRVLRSAAMVVKQMSYVDAARATGASDLRILLRHVLPNCVAPYLVIATAALGTAIIIEAALSFLGLGAAPGTPSWGQMLSPSAQQYMELAPWLVIFPGVAITIAVFGFNLLGDALRDALDPRLRQG